MTENIPGEIKTVDRQIRCCVCGFWITHNEYGGLIRGEYSDFTNKRCGNIIMDVCNECLEKILKYTG